MARQNGADGSGMGAVVRDPLCGNRVLPDAGFCFLIAMTGWMMGIAPVEETVRTLGIGFGLFVVTMLDELIASGLGKIVHM